MKRKKNDTTPQPQKMYIWFVACFFLLLLAGLIFLCVALTSPTYIVRSYVYVDEYLSPPSTAVGLINTGETIKNHEVLRWDGISSSLSIPNTNGCWDVSNDDFTLLVMMRMSETTTSKTTTILGHWLSDASMPLGYGLSFNASNPLDKKLQLELGDGKQTDVQLFSWSNVTLDDNEWHLIAIAVSRKNAVETMCFIDGNLQGARYNTYLAGASLDDHHTFDLNMMIGRRPGPTELAQFWQGDMLLFGVLCETPSVTDLVRMRAELLSE